MLKSLHNTIRTFLKKILFIFREGGREGEKEGALMGNQTGDALVHRLALSPLNHTNQGRKILTVVVYKGIWVFSLKINILKISPMFMMINCYLIIIKNI